MLIATAPIAIPVSTANPSTEAVASEAAHKTLIPEPKSTSESSHTRNSTETNEQPKQAIEYGRQAASNDSEGKTLDDSNEQNAEQSKKEDQKEQRQQVLDDKELAQLKRRDIEVKAHEAAHANAGGQLAGSPVLNYTVGPDGNRYAVSGEVSIDSGKVENDPRATIDKMQQVRKAALAPASPSSQDLKVAAIASQVANQAQIELTLKMQQEVEEKSSNAPKDVSFSDEKNVKRKNNGDNLANPVVARRVSLALNRKIINSGALDDSTTRPLLSQIA